MSAGVVIVRAGPADAPAIARFQVAAWRESYRGIVPDRFLDEMDADASAGRWTQRLTSGEREAFTASVDGHLVAVASTRRSLAHAGLPHLELSTLYLARAVQGSGLADRMLDTAIGDDAAHLLVFAANARAQRFYRRRGFAPVGAPLVDSGTGLAEQQWVRSTMSSSPKPLTRSARSAPVSGTSG